MPTDTLFKPARIGAGGFVTGMSFSDNGRTRLSRTDGNAHVWDGDEWVLNVGTNAVPAAFATAGGGTGVDSSAVSPSDETRAYMAFRGTVMRSNDGAHTWQVTSLSGVATAPNDDFRNLSRSMVVDPGNPDVVYYGSKANGLYWTRDGGTTWVQVAASSVPVGIAYDLADTTTHVYRRTTFSSAGVNYAAAGVNQIAVDRTSAVVTTGGVSRRSIVYAAPYGQGVMRSTDGGDTWAPIAPATNSITAPTAPLAVTSMSVAADGDLFVCSALDPAYSAGNYDNNVWRWNKQTQTWTKITPGNPTRRWTLACDPLDAGKIFMVGAGGDMRYTVDKGATWTRPLGPAGNPADGTGDVPWLAWAATNGEGNLAYMSIGEVKYDPIVAGRVWICEGTGVWYVDLSVSTTTVQWKGRSRGIEHIVGNDIIAPKGGRPLFGGWDRNTFRSPSDDTYPATYGPSRPFGTTWGLAESVTDSNWIAATNCNHHDVLDVIRSGYSTDGGQTWTAFPTLPAPAYDSATPPVASAQRWGYGAVGVGVPGNVVWVPAMQSATKRPFWTKDSGATWNAITLPGVNDYANIYAVRKEVYRHNVAFDRVNPNVCYIYHGSQGMFRSTDGGETWTNRGPALANSPDWLWNMNLETAPSVEGLIYMCTGPFAGRSDMPFVRSTDGGATWTTLSKITGVAAFGLGKPMPGSTHDTIFAAGYVNGTYGIYRSADRGATWVYLDNYPTGLPTTPKSIEGDKDVAGKVYMTTGSAGYAIGELVSAPVESVPGTSLGLYLGDKLVAPGPKALEDGLASKADKDSAGRVPMTQIPDGAKPNGVQVASQAAMLALGAQIKRGHLALRSDVSKTFQLLGDGDPSLLTNWKELPSSGGAGGGFTLPGGGSNGDLLAKTADGSAWATPGLYVPSGGTSGQVLTRSGASALGWSTPASGGGGGGAALDSTGHLPANIMRQITQQQIMFRRPGIVAENLPRNSHHLNLSGSIVANKMTIMGIYLLGGVQVTTLVFNAGASSGTGLTHFWGALLDSSYAPLRLTVDDTSGSVAGGTEKALTLATPFTPSADGYYAVGIAAVGTSLPSLIGAGHQNANRQMDTPALSGFTNTISGLAGPETCPATCNPSTGLAGIPYVQLGG